MTWRLYSDTPPQPKPIAPVEFAPLLAPWSDAPDGYVPEKGLVDAVNVALALSQPLLLTGEPGTGKTQLAYSIASQLGLEDPLVFHTKTTSVARDLFYRYDALRHFRDSHVRGNDGAYSLATDDETIERSIRSYIEYEALGLAILLSMPRPEVVEFIPDRHRASRRAKSVVLIDEVDKAPRDVPNDVLYEMEAFGFTVKETGQSFKAPDEYRPIVVLTSNSERTLPEPFLRRCIFYHLNFPDSDQLKRVVASRLGSAFAARDWVTEAIDKFLKVRVVPMDKRPATAELLAWLRFLSALQEESGENPVAKGIPSASLTILAKTRDGLETLKANLPS